MRPITLTGYIEVPDADLAAVEEHLAQHIELTLSEPGCLSFQVVRCPMDANRFNVQEKFESEEAFEAHQARTKHSDWGRVTKNVARHYTVTIENGASV
ncbi:putative quinol monooxygenase [Immundisolibacter sp.]|uniref:putative quinol monooxygenase n=1 Tax=Immundisolibacter sp. TaxID=1934948 RepID=UPI003F84DE66